MPRVEAPVEAAKRRSNPLQAAQERALAGVERAQMRAEAGVAPTLMAPVFLGEERVAAAWDVVRQSYLHNSLRIEERAALLCAALEREGSRASGVHATGITLVGQPETPINIGRVWHEMMQTPRGKRLLHATMRLGNGHHVDPKILTEIYKDLGPLAAAWQDILRFAAWIDIWHRSQAPFASASSDPHVDEWLKILVEAKADLPNDLLHAPL